jgi:hypothetical protein
MSRREKPSRRRGKDIAIRKLCKLLRDLGLDISIYGFLCLAKIISYSLCNTYHHHGHLGVD